VISAIRQGLGQAHLGKQLTSDLPFRGVVDLDAQFSLGNGKTVTLRVVRMPISVTRRAGQDIPKDVWLVTNLSAECFTAEQIATLYRMRWDIETLFAALKGIGRLDQLRSASLPVITAFLYATLIGLVLAQDICAEMRRRCPKREPSLQRVYILVLTYLPELVTSVGTKRFRSVLFAFEQALWREGRNPNPGRPYSSTRYALDVLNGS